MTVHEELYGPSPELRGSVQLALRTGGKRQQLLVVLRGQGKLAHRFGGNGLAGCRRGCLDGSYLRRNFHLFAHGAGLQRNGNLGCFSDEYFDAGYLCLGKAGFVYNDVVAARRQERRNKRSVGSRRDFAGDGIGGCVDDLHVGTGN